MEKEVLLLKYNLQFFAEEGPGGEKTEPATPKRMQDARKKGQVAKSRELTSAFELLSLFVTLKVYISFMGERFVNFFRWTYEKRLPDFVRSERNGVSVHSVAKLFPPIILNMIILMGPFLIAGFMLSIFGDIIQVGWQISPEPLKPKLSKINPMSGFKRIFSKRAIFELIKSMLKVWLIFYVAYSTLKNHAHTLFILFDMPLNAGMALVGGIIIDTGVKISALYLIIGIMDFFYQKKTFNDEMKMTKKEVKDEYKDTEGDPQIKQRQRQKMQEVSQRRMMKDVPKADVVITNPTHIAVALRYDNEKEEAPKVLAKGADYIAKKIKDAAKEANVMILENKPLARALYATVEIGEEIPPELYEAVAEMLALVYNTKNKKVKI